MVGGFVEQTTNAQFSISFRANIDTQPLWGPSGYNYEEYYYMPDIRVFYYVEKRQYIYHERGR